MRSIFLSFIPFLFIACSPSKIVDNPPNISKGDMVIYSADYFLILNHEKNEHMIIHKAIKEKPDFEDFIKEGRGLVLEPLSDNTKTTIYEIKRSTNIQKGHVNYFIKSEIINGKFKGLKDVILFPVTFDENQTIFKNTSKVIRK